jgi:hypothetical protein
MRVLDTSEIANAQAVLYDSDSANPFAILLPAEVLDRIEFLDLGRFCGPFGRGSMAGCSPELAERLVSIFPSRLTPSADSWTEADAHRLGKAIAVGDEEVCGEFGRRIQAGIDAELRPAGLSADVTGADTPFPEANITRDEPLPSDDELREEMLKAALDYAAKGKPIFPCRPDNKRPLTEHGFKDATCDQAIIRDWWQQYPRAMIGMPTGAASGTFVVDLDRKDDVDGHKTFAEMGLDELDAPAVETPSGGAHLYYQHQDGLRNTAKKALGNGIDTRGDGGYVILPPSMRTDGRRYRWRPVGARTICEVPQIILDRLEHHRRRHEVAAGADGQPSTSERAAERQPRLNGDARNRAYAEAVLRAECERVANAGKGTRNDTLNTAALKVGHYVGSGELSKAEAAGALFEAAVASGLVRDDGPKSVRDTIRSGLQAGMREPRTAPEPGPPPPGLPPTTVKPKTGTKAKAPGMGEADQGEATAKATDPDNAENLLTEFNTDYCVVRDGGKTRVLSFEPHEQRINDRFTHRRLIPTLTSFEDFRNFHLNRKIAV